MGKTFKKSKKSNYPHSISSHQKNNRNNPKKLDFSSHNFIFQLNSEFNPSDAHNLSNDIQYNFTNININQNNSFIGFPNLNNINKNSDNTSINNMFKVLRSGNDGDSLFPNTKKLSNKNELKNKFICKYCQKDFTRKSSLKFHIFQIHSGYEGTPCSFCSVKYKRIKEHEKLCKLKYIDKKNDDLLKSNNGSQKNNHKSEPQKFNSIRIHPEIKISLILLNKKEKKKSYIDFNEFKYYPNNIIGNGGNMVVYFGISTFNKEPVAVKIKNTKKKSSSIDNESYILSLLKNVKYIPSLLFYQKNEKKDIIIETLCGPNINSIIKIDKNLFDPETVSFLGMQLFSILKNIHECGIIHNDIKPSNICFGRFENFNLVDTDSFYLIDFGYSRFYDEYLNNKNIKKNKNTTFINNKKNKENFFEGTPKFMSIDKSEGNKPTRKSDCEELMYTLFYLIKKSLPWDDDEENNHIKNCINMCKIKKNIIRENLFPDIPKEFIYIYKMIRNLEYDEQPDYDAYIILLKHILTKNEELENERKKILGKEKMNILLDAMKNFLTEVNNQNEGKNILGGYPFIIK